MSLTLVAIPSYLGPGVLRLPEKHRTAMTPQSHLVPEFLGLEGRKLEPAGNCERVAELKGPDESHCTSNKRKNLGFHRSLK